RPLLDAVTVGVEQVVIRMAEYADQPLNLDIQAGFLARLAAGAVCDALARFERAARHAEPVEIIAPLDENAPRFVEHQRGRVNEVDQLWPHQRAQPAHV